LGIYVGLTEESFTDFVKEISFDFQKGDIMILYTDGATEAENEKGELYSVERLMNSLPKYRHLKSSEIVAKMTEDIYQFIGRKPILDDISLVVIQRM
jgi:sigma-B regulation protein RsbU (phosphoserine phosphatase)